MKTLSWKKCQGNKWCSLVRLDLKSVSESGVYVIWHGGPRARVVYVGQGDVAGRLRAHRADPDILAYGEHGSLMVTWAAVPADQRDGVERHLADTLSPLLGDHHPTAPAVPVIGPWS